MEVHSITEEFYLKRGICYISLCSEKEEMLSVLVIQPGREENSLRDIISATWQGLSLLPSLCSWLPLAHPSPASLTGNDEEIMHVSSHVHHRV